VGKTHCRIGQDCSVSVHPHERGEDSETLASIAGPAGSPPRAWGRPQRGRREQFYRRFTPTSVGKTYRRALAASVSSVHPHERGEDSRGCPKAKWARGSPPRAWGRLNSALIPTRNRRFTPTSVGKTLASSLALAASSVHPHERGEDEPFTLSMRITVGSPPRAWGRPELTPPRDHKIRFTPTSVGKTGECYQSATFCPVHPHERGEDSACVLAYRPVFGSPPRAWGRLELERLHGWPVRFTPTSVGKTSSHS